MTKFGTMYSGSGMVDPAKVVSKAVEQCLWNRDFDSIVGTGLSGALVIPSLAHALGRSWAIVRKDSDHSHSTERIEGEIGDSWIFVDDFTESGRTFKRVHGIVQSLAPTSFVGGWLYSSPSQGWRWPDELRVPKSPTGRATSNA